MPREVALERLRRRFGDKVGRSLTLLEVAASDHEGSATFFEERDAGETSSLVPGAARPGARVRVVPTVTLDGLLEKLPARATDLLKVDAEGFDGRVLAGAMKAFAEHRIGIAQFEYNAPWQEAGTTL